jgi:hypothetical protein
MEQMQLKQIKENYEKIFDWKDSDKKRESVWSAVSVSCEIYAMKEERVPNYKVWL